MTDVLRKQDLCWIYEDVLSAASKWNNLGLALGLNSDELDTIKAAQPDSPTECLKEVLKLWLSKSSQSPTLKTLISALRKSTVGYEELASTLEEKYRSSKIQISQPTTEAVEPVAHDSQLQQRSTSQQSRSPANKPVKRPSTSHNTPNPKRKVCASLCTSLQ